ncbi:kinase-like domain-containing protein, partial [Trichophaea hybrida]
HEDKNCIYIVMEHVEMGRLERFININWTEDDTKIVAKQVLEGLKFIHIDGIIHRVFKACGFYLPLTLRIKIGDFGVSKRIINDNSTVAETQTGSRDYMAPKVLDRPFTIPDYTNFVDHWALGCILYRMVTGVTPFSSIGVMYQYKFGHRRFPSRQLSFAYLLSKVLSRRIHSFE